MIIIPTRLARPAEAQRDELMQRLNDVEEREAACCPENVPFDEYIRALEEQLARARADIKNLNTLIKRLDKLILETNSVHIENQWLKKDLDGEREINRVMTAEIESLEKRCTVETIKGGKR